MSVRRDAFHAMQRLSMLVLRSRGSFLAYFKRLRGSVFIVNADDLAPAEEDVRDKRIRQEEVDREEGTPLSLFRLETPTVRYTGALSIGYNLM